MDQKKKILVIEDSMTNRKIIISLLKSLDPQIFEAESGDEGLRIAKNQPLDLIVTDMDMPKISGIELCHKLKESNRTRGIPVIIVSNFVAEEFISQGIEAGANAYIDKGELKDTLLQHVKQILSKSSFTKSKTVLVVDDSQTIRKTVEHGLAKAGFKVALADNGLVALQMVGIIKPDLIVSDINMPEMDGYALCDALQDDENFRSIPFLVMSSNSDRSHMIRMIQHGASSYIVKPFNIDQLVLMVEKLLSDQFLLILKEKERISVEQRAMLATIESLVTALEARDAYTKGHSLAVAQLASDMLALTGADNRDLEIISMGCKLHDIGKIGIADAVLLKPGKLTREEYNIIKKHPSIGTNILKSVPSLEKILPIIMSHHERIDGKGYPEGLKGLDIPLWARLTAVADTYDALTSDRPYRKGMSQDKAFQIIEENRGTQLCGECVDLLFTYFQSKSI